MYSTGAAYHDPDEQKAGVYQSHLFKWKSMGAVEKRLFMTIFRVRRDFVESLEYDRNAHLADWVTREQIAQGYDRFRLTPYQVKLLNHLAKIGFIHASKRTRWRMTYEGRKRPAGYEWVYLPDPITIEALQNQGKPKVAPKMQQIEDDEFSVKWWERPIFWIMDKIGM